MRKYGRTFHLPISRGATSDDKIMSSLDGLEVHDLVVTEKMDGENTTIHSGGSHRAKVFLALVAAIKKWAASLNASHSFIHVMTGARIEATDRLMRAAGAKFIGGTYALV